MNVFTSASESECNLAADGLRGNTSRSVSNLENQGKKHLYVPFGVTVFKMKWQGTCVCAIIVK